MTENNDDGSPVTGVARFADDDDAGSSGSHDAESKSAIIGLLERIEHELAERPNPSSRFLVDLRKLFDQESFQQAFDRIIDTTPHDEQTFYGKNLLRAIRRRLSDLAVGYAYTQTHIWQAGITGGFTAIATGLVTVITDILWVLIPVPIIGGVGMIAISYFRGQRLNVKKHLASYSVEAIDRMLGS
jgi:hypothetical protein